jgi:hypothetical protein
VEANRLDGRAPASRLEALEDPRTVQWLSGPRIGEHEIVVAFPERLAMEGIKLSNQSLRERDGANQAP